MQQQVDPHLLFNNLNILFALSKPANTAAFDYVSYLASLYRYLVRDTQREAVPVAEKMAFARDYQFLLQRRFGTAYVFEENVQLAPAQLTERLVPPGVLQELLTNAVKHNLASWQQPLPIRLTISPTALRLEHPRRPCCPAPAVGTGRGLVGLRALGSAHRPKWLWKRALIYRHRAAAGGPPHHFCPCTCYSWKMKNRSWTSCASWYYSFTPPVRWWPSASR